MMQRFCQCNYRQMGTLLQSTPLSVCFQPESQWHLEHMSLSIFTRSASSIVSDFRKTENEEKSLTIIPSPVMSVNYHISRRCNYSCKFCFHTEKNSAILQLEQAKVGLEMLKDAGTEKINFAGGEPFLHPKFLGELCKTSNELGMAVSIISNGSLIGPKWLRKYGHYIDVLGISIDSFDPETNSKIGRGGDANNRHVDRVLRVRDLCSKHNIIFKMNTVVCKLNWDEDMRENIRRLEPQRWKVFQVLILEDENSGQPGELRDARPLRITDEEYAAFLSEHAEVQQLIPEPNNMMQNSYLILDEDMRFLDCSKGGKVPSESLLKVGVGKALEQSGFDQKMFVRRGGVYDWKRDR